jgi:excisionase family DNA binding protein
MDQFTGTRSAQVRKGQHLTQHDIADYLGVGLGTVRTWEAGLALPDRSLWTKLDEALGVPVPDPRVPEHTPAERELIDTLLLVTDELRQLREQLANGVVPITAQSSSAVDPKVVNVNGAAEYMGVSISLIRGLVAERRLVFYKLGSRVMFRKSDLDQFIEDGKREVGRYEPWQLQGRSGKSPRKSR